jgi:acyl carrier protein phosphodiesterase
MNHLAHLFLARPTPLSLVGNLAGDFVKGALGGRFLPEVREGIEQHRRIDAFTDSHPSVAAFRRVLVPEHGHYARVISDMFFDHFLACRFEEYAGESLDTFLARTVAMMDPHIELMPGRLRWLYPHIRDEQWLQSYRDIDAMHDALRNISYRFSRRPRLETSTRHLVDSRDELEAHFRTFFAEAMAIMRA